MNIVVEVDAEQMGRRAAQDGAQFIRDAIAERGEANVIVATGASQFTMLAALVEAGGICRIPPRSAAT